MSALGKNTKLDSLLHGQMNSSENVEEEGGSIKLYLLQNQAELAKLTERQSRYFEFQRKTEQIKQILLLDSTDVALLHAAPAGAARR